MRIFELAKKRLDLKMLPCLQCANDNAFLTYNNISITKAENKQHNHVQDDTSRPASSMKALVPEDYFRVWSTLHGDRRHPREGWRTPSVAHVDSPCTRRSGSPTDPSLHTTLLRLHNLLSKLLLHHRRQLRRVSHHHSVADPFPIAHVIPNDRVSGWRGYGRYRLCLSDALGPSYLFVAPLLGDLLHPALPWPFPLSLPPLYSSSNQTDRPIWVAFGLLPRPISVAPSLPLYVHHTISYMPSTARTTLIPSRDFCSAHKATDGHEVESYCH